MIGERALVVLESLINGRTEGAVTAELDELVALELAITVDPTLLRRAQDLEDLGKRYRATTEAQFRDALKVLDEKLRSDFHRMISFASTIRREEEDRAHLRGVLGTLADSATRMALEAAVGALRQAANGAPFVGCAGTTRHFAITEAGRRAASGLRVRVERYGKVDFREFVKRFRKADAGMAALAEQQGWLAQHLPFVPKGRTAVITGLMKTGLAPQAALDRFERAMKSTGSGWLPVERPHLAATLVRCSAQAKDHKQAESDLQRAYDLLCSMGLPNGPVLRGAAKTLIGAPDLRAAAERFLRFFTAFAPTGFGAESRVRFSARLMPVAGTPEELVARCQQAAKMQGGVLSERCVALVSLSPDAATFESNLRRYPSIEKELLARRAFRGSVPDSAVNLVAIPGAPAEVVELVRQLVAHLPAAESEEAWGMSDDWEPAVAFAKRFAY